MGMPGWPDFAASTASIDKARIAFAMRCNFSRGQVSQVDMLEAPSKAAGACSSGKSSQMTPPPVPRKRALFISRGLRVKPLALPQMAFSWLQLCLHRRSLR
jgi:hypothetical protein